jgi:hypothetical protein
MSDRFKHLAPHFLLLINPLKIIFVQPDLNKNRFLMITLLWK